MTPTLKLRPVPIELDVPSIGPVKLSLVWSARAAMRAEELGFNLMDFQRQRRQLTCTYAALWAMIETHLTSGDDAISQEEFFEGMRGFPDGDLLEKVTEAMTNAAPPPESDSPIPALDDPPVTAPPAESETLSAATSSSGRERKSAGES